VNGPFVSKKQCSVAYFRLSHTSPTPPITLPCNPQVDSFFPDELYQGYIAGLPAGKWWTIQLPFRDMTLTRLGRLSYIQKELDSTFALESIGFLVADGKPGPFRLEIGGVKAVAKIEGRLLKKVVGWDDGDNGGKEKLREEGKEEGEEAEEEAERRSKAAK